jgi:hypothetical protein
MTEVPSGTGGVAQLGERLLCKQEVIGSIPFTSTTIFGGVERAGLAHPLSLGMKFLFATQHHRASVAVCWLKGE